MKKFVSFLVKGTLNSRISSVVNCPRSGVSCSPQGFTLLELLIVVSIIAILSVALVLVLDPAETLKKSRDAQRMSDMSTIKTAIALYLTSTTTPNLGGISSNGGCKATATGAWDTPATARIYYSLAGVSGTTLDGTLGDAQPAPATGASLTDGTGWIPVNFDSLTGGSPISNIPVDPVNTVGTPSAPTSADFVYRYACSVLPAAFEVNAQLESTAYTASENKRLSDGGNSNAYYEVGTNLKIMGFASTTVNF